MSKPKHSSEQPENDSPLAAWFLGPKAEHGDVLFNLLTYIFQDYIHWRRNYFPTDPVVISRERRREHEVWQDRLNASLDTILNNLKADYPVHSPRYIAHMISELSIPSMLGYFAGMLYNPNNVTDEAAPVTVRLELEVGRMVAEMLGYQPNKAWAHICSGGTIANLEALWVARMVQFVPFIVRDYCQRHAVEFAVKTANGQQAHLGDLSDRELIGLRPNESIFMIRKVARYEVEVMGREQQAVLDNLNHFVRASDYNIKLRGFDQVIKKVGMRPVIFVSAAAHYCLMKTANILGYGEDCVRLVPVTFRFRLDSAALQSMLDHLPEREYIAAVTGIVGTTEEGAIDPIHEIIAARDWLGQAKNQAFWLHLDAAWGGYIRSLFCGHALDEESGQTLDETCALYVEAINATETLLKNFGNDYPVEIPAQGARLTWDSPTVYKALIAMPEADSIAIDPHKMGYVPYPAGIVAFKNGLVTELMTQRAQYISDEQEGIKAVDKLIEIKAVGPYILEGSKPGAAATACWLAHTTIPLDVHHHGKIVRTTLLNAKKLFWYLQRHRKNFATFEAACGFPTRNKTRFSYPFTFIPLFNPDTNIICFVARPMAWQANKLVPAKVPLKWINEFNKRIRDELDIPKAGRGTQLPYAKEYFVSTTTFEQEQYSSQSIEFVLNYLHLSPQEYNQHGLLVLRSTVMNPLYYTAQQEGIDYLAGFVTHLHKVARFVIVQIHNLMKQSAEIAGEMEGWKIKDVPVFQPSSLPDNPAKRRHE
jgi:glutamate/tyrosine decarboxylase-like PLP-dependent enzyme